jgi:hypothetical protein
MAGGDDYGRWGTTAPVATGRSRTSSPTSWYSRTGPRGLARRANRRDPDFQKRPPPKRIPDLPDARPLPGQPGAQRVAQVRGTGRGMGIARHRRRAGPAGGASQGEPASRRRAIASSRWDQLQPRPMTPSNKGHLWLPGCGAFGQHRQERGTPPAPERPRRARQLSPR